MAEKVAMRHPDLKHTTDEPVLVTEAAFKVWEKAGWQLAAKKHQPQEEENE
jgi:hypothetical protein